MDDLCLYILKKILKEDIKIISIKSGGQTGVDEAGIKASVILNIPAIILAPKGWKFRNKFGKDIFNEKLFKNRF